MLWYCRARSKQFKVIPERLLEIWNGQAIPVKQRRDISVIVVAESLKDVLRHVRKSAAKRVANYYDVLNMEQVIQLRYRHQSGRGATTADRHSKDGASRDFPLAYNPCFAICVWSAGVEQR